MFYPGETVLYRGETYYVLRSPRVAEGGLRYMISSGGPPLYGVSEDELDFASTFQGRPTASRL